MILKFQDFYTSLNYFVTKSYLIDLNSASIFFQFLVG
jgi:hypothetical protein